MSSNESMTIDERYKYFRMMKKRYKQADKPAKGRLLDEMQAMTALHRKALIRIMNGTPERKPRSRQRGRSYGPEVDDALRVIAESLDYICAERLTPSLVPMAEHLVVHGELQVTPQLLHALDKISVPTVRRHLQRLQQDQPYLPRKRVHRQASLLRDIPMKRIPWNQAQPGHFEVDLVHHCGAIASGEYLYTLHLVDIATGWSERVALLGRSFCAMEAGFKHCVARLPFPIREIHPDNGSEFLNDHLVRFFRTLNPAISISRSRPYRPNDNRCVEQKNASLVRAYLGNERLDTVQQTRALNQLYDAMWVHYNLFQPVLHLHEKTVDTAPDHSFHVTRRYDQAQTPFQRLCAIADQNTTSGPETIVIADATRARLERLRDSTNPRRLRQKIYTDIDSLFALPGATPGVTENVYDTIPITSSILKGEDTLVTLSVDRAVGSR